MDEVNRNPDLLPNSSFVFECLEHGCDTGPKIYSHFHFSEEVRDFPPNYMCHEITMCNTVLTGPNLASSVIIANMLNLFISQQVRFSVVTLQEILILLL